MSKNNGIKSQNQDKGFKKYRKKFLGILSAVRAIVGFIEGYLSIIGFFGVTATSFMYWENIIGENYSYILCLVFVGIRAAKELFIIESIVIVK